MAHKIKVSALWLFTETGQGGWWRLRAHLLCGLWTSLPALEGLVAAERVPRARALPALWVCEEGRQPDWAWTPVPCTPTSWCSRRGADGGGGQDGPHPGPGGQGQKCVHAHMCTGMCIPAGVCDHLCTGVCMTVYSCALSHPSPGSWQGCDLVAAVSPSLAVSGGCCENHVCPGPLGAQPSDASQPLCLACLPSQGWCDGPALLGTQEQDPLQWRWLGRRTSKLAMAWWVGVDRQVGRPRGGCMVTM